MHFYLSYKYLSRSICAVEESCQGYSRLWHFFLSTRFCLVSLMAQKMWRLSVSVFVHDRYSHAGNCTGLPSKTGLFLFTDNIFLFLLQRHLTPFDSWPLLLLRFSRAWHQSFVIGVYDLFFSSPLIFFLIIGHRYLVMNLHVVQF